MVLLVPIPIFLTIEKCEQVFQLQSFAGGGKRKKSPRLTFVFSFEKAILRCHKIRKLCMVNKLTIVNKFVHRTDLIS